ncbi:hypothetical protein GGR51DRAFT_535479 [Nemania sp. FL0031]|nr:hypothetical protein GGR51DRAFT_535479 [Nemania sp. FL0031]
MTLSHRWGANETFKLTKANILSMKQNVPWDSIPKLYQDAIKITRELQINYIWIDSLCIIQVRLFQKRYCTARIHANGDCRMTSGIEHRRVPCSWIERGLVLIEQSYERNFWRLDLPFLEGSQL